jgi:hypothetical protein
MFSTAFELKGVDLPFFSCAEQQFKKNGNFGVLKKNVLPMGSRCIFMAYGIILKHLERWAFRRERGRGTLF